jgi:hypothetical protein
MMRLPHGFPLTAPADDWCRETAARMIGEGYAAGVVIRYLEAYGCGLYAAQAIVRRLKDKSAHCALRPAMELQ